MATDKKFSDFVDGGEFKVGDQAVGLRTSDLSNNYKFEFPSDGFKDASGNYLFKYESAGSIAVNAPKVFSSVSGNAVIYTADGSDTDINVSLQPKLNGQLILDELFWPNSDGLPGTFLKTDGAGNLSFTATPVVTSAEGTANQVLVNGTSGTPQVGDIVFSAPQDIAPTSSPTFAALTLTTPLSLASGGSNKALVANTGGILFSDADSFEVLAGTATARRMLQSGSTAAPAWSTTTWPDTTTINQILFSSAANTISAITTANSAMLYTNSTGVPAFSASMTNGQVMVGSTGASPAPATLTAGTGVTITNAAASITVSATGGGMTWTEVTGTSHSMAIDSGYIANNGSLVTLTLPSTAAVGTAISVIGKGAGGWLIAQNTGQSIRISGSTTTVGVGGSLASNTAGDSINLICTTANTVWTARGAPQGIITIV